jgi:hypothetical protein
MTNRPKSYLGDGCFAEVSPRGELMLTTHDGMETTNVIYLGPDEWKALVEYMTPQPPQPATATDEYGRSRSMDRRPETQGKIRS